MSNTTNIYKIGDIAIIKSGFAFKKAIRDTDNGYVTVVQVKDVRENRPIPWDNLCKVEESPLMSGNALGPDMVLFAAKGTRNFAWHVDIDPGYAVCTSLFHVIVPDMEIIDPAFLTWQINQSKSQTYLEQISAGITVKNIRIDAFKALPIMVPAMDIQKKVVRHANAALNERHVLTQLIENRDKEMKAIATKILSGNQQ